MNFECGAVIFIGGIIVGMFFAIALYRIGKKINDD